MTSIMNGHHGHSHANGESCGSSKPAAHVHSEKGGCCDSPKIELPQTESDGTVSYNLPNGFKLDGVMFPGFCSKQLLQSKMAGVEMRDTDVLVGGYAKSGTTWLLETTSAILSGGDMAWMRDNTLQSRVFLMDDYNNAENGGAAKPDHRLFKCHLPYRFLPDEVGDKKVKVVIATRNPKDVACSYYYMHQSSHQYGNYVAPWHEYLDRFMAGKLAFGSWFDFNNGFVQNRRNFDVLVVRYEDMKADTKAEVRRICQFLERDLTERALDDIVHHIDFDNMKKNENAHCGPCCRIDRNAKTPFFRKGRTGDWKNHFTVAQSERMDKVYAIKMKNTELGFEGLM